MKMPLLISVCLVASLLIGTVHMSCERKSPWTWKCIDKKCMKEEVDNSTSTTELNICKLTCGEYSLLFPKPTGRVSLAKTVVSFHPKYTQLKVASTSLKAKTKGFIKRAFKDFKDTSIKVFQRLSKQRKSTCRVKASELRKLFVTVNVKSDSVNLTLNTDESYSLSVNTGKHRISADIYAETYFGARHALETLSQLFVFHYEHGVMKILRNADIVLDRPAYKYRGLMLDTSRNFFSVKSILRILKGMSYDKLNTFHWHITDTASFPIEIKSVPELSAYGAYDTSQIYTHADVRRIVEEATYYGIRVVPELNLPAGTGEGWQWGPHKDMGDLSVCGDRTPWSHFCFEPPCGQLDPSNQHVYKVLSNVLREYFDLFQPEIMHVGGDEVNLNCWNSTESIATWVEKQFGGVQTDQFMDMWAMFLEKVGEEIDDISDNIPLMIWSSNMTSEKYLLNYTDPNKHIIQIWNSAKDKDIAHIVKMGYRTVFSTRDSLYLDCGFGDWTDEGNNWCSPYKDWKLMYNTDPLNTLRLLNLTVTDNMKESILGQEAAMWTEQVDEYSVESKVWPRTSALAERLWSNPPHGWALAVERVRFHRERLVDRGVMADALQPKWCEQNPSLCYSVNPKNQEND